jgi:hypothetical protein
MLILLNRLSLQNERRENMPNQILVIKPYWHLGTWVFDDPATDLVQEPFRPESLK